MDLRKKALLALMGFGMIQSQVALGEEELVSVIVCGASVSPKVIQIQSSVGTRGALLLTRGATNYGSIQRTMIFGKREARRIPQFTAPDIDLQDGDILEIPLARIFDQMARSRQYVVTSPQPFPEFRDGFFSEPGEWRGNWRYGRKGREFRHFDGHHPHLTFVSTSQGLLEKHIANLGENQHFCYLSFDDLRATTKESIFLQREARILADMVKATNGRIHQITDFGLKAIAPLAPKEENEPGEQGSADQPATAPESKADGQKKPKPESEGRYQ